MSTDALAACVERPCSLATSVSRALAPVPISVSDPQLEYCLALAHKNMSPYLERRGEQFNDERWRQLAPQAEFFLVVDTASAVHKTVGFFSVRRDPDSPCALHVGDVQIDASQQNRGAGSAALGWIEALARSRGLTELTLNVFRDNPALQLYERFGFLAVDTRFYKYKMRKTLPA
jgi:ribosomal protein S18 acetylase RimI-like enzyme